MGPQQRYIAQAVLAAERYLVLSQDTDGYWRDYALSPGASEDWSTACVGYVLSTGPYGRASAGCLRAAVQALHGARRPDGWGYSRNTPCDADSTAWVLRFLGAAAPPSPRLAVALLQPWLDVNGGAHTFTDARAGDWATVHDDVTPMLGLALLAVDGPRQLVARIRRRVLDSQQKNGAWQAYWWTTDAYAVAQSLAFLSATGGIPGPTASASRTWLGHAQAASSAFEAAQLALISAYLFRADAAADRIAHLLALQTPRGAWPPSPTLREPPRSDSQHETLVHADQRGLMSTAMGILALRCFVTREANSRHSVPI
jgi:hypothetical protein